MEELRIKAKELLAAGTVKVVIGYGKGTADVRRPVFVRSADKATELVFDASCTQNLATYLTKAEVRAMGRMAIVAVPSTLRSILQLAAERQVPEENVLALAVLDGALKELTTFDAIEQTVATIPDAISPTDQAMLDKLTEQSRGYSTYVLPEEDLEVKLSSFFAKIKDPVL